MRDRLIELLKDSEMFNNADGKADMQFLADHLLANGVIVPPVKKGDKVYCDGKYFADHCSGEVMEFYISGVTTEAFSTHRGWVDMVWDFADFGKTVFLTKEEAEQKLREMESAK